MSPCRMDAYGYLIYVEEVDEIGDYALLIDTQDKKNFSNNRALLVFADGTEKIVDTTENYTSNNADDYIPKPFRPRELISRMNSVLRRYHRGSQPLEYHELKADTVRGLVYKNNVELTLSALEYRLLLLFLSNQSIVLTRSRLLDELWDMAGGFVNDNTLTVYIKRLREKIEADPAHPEYIKTIRGLGYKLGD